MLSQFCCSSCKWYLRSFHSGSVSVLFFALIACRLWFNFAFGFATRTESVGPVQIYDFVASACEHLNWLLMHFRGLSVSNVSIPEARKPQSASLMMRKATQKEANSLGNQETEKPTVAHSIIVLCRLTLIWRRVESILLKIESAIEAFRKKMLWETFFHTINFQPFLLRCSLFICVGLMDSRRRHLAPVTSSSRCIISARLSLSPSKIVLHCVGCNTRSLFSFRLINYINFRIE